MDKQSSGRRRKWTAEEKLQILDEALSAGATIAAVAGRRGVSHGLLYHRLRFVREVRLRDIAMNRPSSQAIVSGRDRERWTGTGPIGTGTLSTIEIALANGRVLEIEESFDPAALARVVAALDRGGS